MAGVDQLRRAAGRGLGNFTRVFADYRFVPAFSHIGLYLVYWLVGLMVLVVALALLLHGRIRRTTAVVRFLYYLPGAFAGASRACLLWLILLDPVASPAGHRCSGCSGWGTLAADDRARATCRSIFMVIAFWTGAGGWIIIMYGALNGISEEVLEAARIDGANGLQIALRIQLPMLQQVDRLHAHPGIRRRARSCSSNRNWSVTASFGQVSDDWSPNQLSYEYAFAAGDFNGAAAIAVYLLFSAFGCAASSCSRRGCSTGTGP